jgi:hypothetical protein
MLPNMANTVQRFERPVTLHTITQANVNFRPVNTPVDSAETAVVQPANKDKINPDIIDWSLDYKQMHSRFSVKLIDQVTVDGVKYKIVESGNYNAYGYYESLLEEIK